MENQELKKKVMTLISNAKTLDRIETIEARIRVSPNINRRTVAGRELTEELLNEANTKALKLQKGELPF